MKRLFKYLIYYIYVVMYYFLSIPGLLLLALSMSLELIGEIAETLSTILIPFSFKKLKSKLKI